MTDLATAASQMREAGFQEWDSKRREKTPEQLDAETYKASGKVWMMAQQAYTAGYHDAFANDLKPPVHPKRRECYMMGVAECEREKAFEARRIG